jgi:hypothetical protein
MGMITGVCRNCAASFSFKAGKKTECTSCGRVYSMKKKAGKLDIKMKSGLLIQGLTEAEAAEGLEKGRFISTDSISSIFTPWVEIKDFPPLKKPAEKESRAYIAGYVLFIFSLLVNLVLLGIIYMQHEKIEILTR